MTNGMKICSLLAQDLTTNILSVHVHSRFHNATNLVSSQGLITILAPSKCLQPYSFVLDETIDFEKLPDRGLTISHGGVFSNGNLIISFQGTAVIDLYLDKSLTLRYEAAKALEKFLCDKVDNGLVSLVFNKIGIHYVDFLKPRIRSFRDAMKKKELACAIGAITRIAGCGPGLTPSADDFLCGYLACLPTSTEKDCAQLLACAAANKTNDISAALLKKAGQGYFSEDILNLVKYLSQNSSDANIKLALKKVADFGSSSGCDFLVGMYFSILDFYENGGRESEKNGSSQECLL